MDIGDIGRCPFLCGTEIRDFSSRSPPIILTKHVEGPSLVQATGLISIKVSPLNASFYQRHDLFFCKGQVLTGGFRHENQSPHLCGR